MSARDRGKIVQVGSALAYRAIPLQAAYCGSKFAIRGFTDSIRTELLHDKQQRADHDGPATRCQHARSSTGAARSCRSIRSRCRRSISLRSPPRRCTGPRITAAVSCGSATARSRRSLATSSRRASPTGTWPRPASRGQQIKDMPVAGERAGNLFAPVPGGAATHGIFDDQAKTRAVPQLWAATHRARRSPAHWPESAAAGAAGARKLAR